MKDFLIYCVFLFTVCFVAFGSCPSSMFHLTKAIRSIFVETTFTINEKELSLKDICFPFQIWQYLEKVFLKGLYVNYFDENSTKGESNHNINILSENKLLGAPRLRQLRVKNDSCTIYGELKIFFSECFAEYSYSTEDKEPFGLKTGTLWTYSDPNYSSSVSYQGKLARYRGGGYYTDFPLLKNESLLLLQNLQSLNWIDRHTRVIFLDFTLYNANFNLFCITKIVFERSPAGYIVTSWSIDTSNLLLYVDWFDFILLALECIYVIILIYYSIILIKNYKEIGRLFLKEIWNIIEIVIIIISYAAIIFDIYNFIYLYQNLGILIKHSSEYLDFEQLDAMRVEMNELTAFLIFFQWMKLFKYINVNIPIFQLSMTLRKCAKDILAFTLMFLIIFFAFAQVATLIFGGKLYNYHTFAISSFTLLRMILGDFNYNELVAIARNLGPLFFFSYTFTVFFVLLNVFLAIITETYIQVKSQVNFEEDIIWSSFATKIIICRNFIDKLFHRKKKSQNLNTEQAELSKNPSSEDVVSLPHFTPDQDPESLKNESQTINTRSYECRRALLFLDHEKELKILTQQMADMIQKTSIEIDNVFDKIKVITDLKSINLQTASIKNM